MTERENYIRAARFENPEYIPMRFAINHSCYTLYDQNMLFDLMEEHKLLFPDFVRPEIPYIPEYALVSRKDQPYTDDFGCLWKTTENGVAGTVVKHPLADLDNFKNYIKPDPEKCMGIGKIDWEKEEKKTREEKREGKLIVRGLRHGHTFLQLSDLCGYENLLFAMADDNPVLYDIIDMVEQFNSVILKKYATIGVDVMTLAEDLGMQNGPMISPEYFLKYIKPSYKRLMNIAKTGSNLIHMHSDGDIRTLVEYLLDSGVDIINLQDNVNGVEWIKENLAGKYCIELDIDRQFVTAKGTPKDIDELIRNEVKSLSVKQGGLMMFYDLYGGIPYENIKATMDAMEKYMFYYS